jgi:hypothetical protein
MKLIIEFEIKLKSPLVMLPNESTPIEVEEINYKFVTDKKLLKFLDKDIIVRVTKDLRQYLLNVKP